VLNVIESGNCAMFYLFYP